MRHPLFVDPNTSAAGLPRNILNADGEVEIFNTNVDPSAVWAITLYVWWHTNSEVPANPPSLLGRVYNNGESPSSRVVVMLPATFFTALSAAQSPSFAPHKIIDKLCLRGNQVLRLLNSVVASENCFVWGYAERVGETPIGVPFRPLQPEGNALVSPFNGDPRILVVPDQDSGEQVIHKLSDAYIDYLTLNVGAAAGTGSSAALVMPDGAEILMPFTVDGGGASVPQLPPYPVFEGIPMRAPSSADVNLALALTVDGGKQGFMNAYGHFLRA